MKALAGLAVLLSASMAFAESGWLASTARLDAPQRYEVFAGPNGVGAGAQLERASRMSAWSAEASWALASRVLEVRGDLLWLLRKGSWVSLGLSVGASLYVVPGPFDAGLGPHGAFTVNIGRRVLSLQMGVQTEVDLFVLEPGPRFPERLFLGVCGAAGPIGWSVLGRAGADLEVGHQWTARADAVLTLAWLSGEP